MGAPDKLVNIQNGKQQQNGCAVTSMNLHARDRDRETLRTIIKQWNANRLDLFELSEPDENLEFYGVMRFYFQEDTEKVSTKCVRITSVQEVKDVVDLLIEKFRPDMRMLTQPHYGLYEVHANGEERRLRSDEKPLLVQLNWHKDDREGRFLLKNEDEQRRPGSKNEGKDFKRRLSQREKKEQKKKEKEAKLQAANEAIGVKTDPENDAERLFKQLPETSFHRSISNPEAVMKRRRQQKLEKKLQQFKSKNGGPDTGGTLKIFGETINPDVPYKTLLLSVDDTVENVVKQALEKYGLDRESYSQYCLVQAVLPPGTENVDPGSVRETILAPTDCPLRILMQFSSTEGTLVFNLKKRSDVHNFQPESGISRPLLVQNPYLIESLPNGHGHAVQLFPGITEVGNNHSRLGAANFIHLPSPDILPLHCIFHRGDNAVTVTTSGDPAVQVVVDGRRIDKATVLQNGSSIHIGHHRVFKFCTPQLFGMTSNGNHATRERLQLPLAPITQLKPSPDTMSRKPVIPHPETIEADMLDTSSSVSYSHRSSPDVHQARHGGGGMSSRLPILPATLEFREDREDSFLFGIVLNPNPLQVTFKLSPTYVLYMAARYRASTNFRPEIVPVERASLLSKFLKKMSTTIFRVLQEHHTDPEYLAFWMANASELLHLLKLDRHMSPYGTEAHEILTECIHLAFHHLIRCQQELLQHALPGLFVPHRESQDDGWGNVLSALSATMALMRRCRLNAGLTIQVFSQLFHFVNMWLFNTLVRHVEQCNQYFGNWLHNGLENILRWAETQGLEIAADCHLSKIVQAAALLSMPKSEETLSNYAEFAWRLNSHQVHFLLSHYEPSVHEQLVPSEIIEYCTNVARSTVDNIILSSGQNVQLEEEPDLQSVFIIPEDGYSFEMVTQVPVGLQEFLDPLTRNKICEMTIHPFSHGVWTVYLSPSSGDRSPSTSFDGGRPFHPTQHLPNIIEVSFPKGNSGIGLSIVAARDPTQDKLGIYIKSVVKGGAADSDGRLQSGDQLLKVNGKSLVGVTQDRAAELIAQSGSQVHLEVLKQGAIAHGLATLLNSPSPPPSVGKKPHRDMKPLPPYPSSEPANYPTQNGTIPRSSTLPRSGMNHPLQPQSHHTHLVTPTRQPQGAFDFTPAAVKQIGHDQNGHRFQPSGGRSPSPAQRMIASHMYAERDQMRKDAKMFEMEDELRRRREHIQSPNGNRSPMTIQPRQIINGHRNIPNETIDGMKEQNASRQPAEKRVQWAIDNPPRKQSPEIPTVRVAIPPSPAKPNAPMKSIHDIPPWSRASDVSPSNSPWQREENHQMREWRLNESRRLRDEQIEILQARECSLKLEEKNLLEALLLERKFQQRADEVIHRGDEEEEEPDDDDDEERSEGLHSIQPPFHIPKTTPHHHHPTAAAAPEVYRTREQHDYDQFIRRHEVHTVNEAIRRSREHLNGVQTVTFTQPQQKTFPLPEIERRSASPRRMMDREENMSTRPKQTYGMEIRSEVEASRSGMAAVVGSQEVYNDPRNRILNAKSTVKPPVGNETSPEKLSFQDKMKMFAEAVGEDLRDKNMASSRQREIEYNGSYH